MQLVWKEALVHKPLFFFAFLHFFVAVFEVAESSQGGGGGGGGAGAGEGGGGDSTVLKEVVEAAKLAEDAVNTASDGASGGGGVGGGGDVPPSPGLYAAWSAEMGQCPL